MPTMDETFSMRNGLSLSERQVSGFPLSLPTGLSFESLFPRQIDAYDPDRKIPQNINVADYAECWISLSTIFRNMVSSMDRQVAMKVSPREYADTIETEIDVINGLFMNEGHGACLPVFYNCSYAGLAKAIPRMVQLRKQNTEIQKAYANKLEQTIKLLTRTNDAVRLFDYEIKTQGPRKNALILTHHPWDLLSFKHFNRLDLLESNTGRLKSRYLWNTKFYPVGDADMTVLPFTRKLLLLLGDRVQIQPSDFKLRRYILEVAIAKKWTSMTTDAKVLADLLDGTNDPSLHMLINTV